MARSLIIGSATPTALGVEWTTWADFTAIVILALKYLIMPCLEPTAGDIGPTDLSAQEERIKDANPCWRRLPPTLVRETGRKQKFSASAARPFELTHIQRKRGTRIHRHRKSIATHLYASKMLQFWRQQASFKPAEVRGANLHGQTAVVTGSNTGVGFHTARQLLNLGLTRLILAVRDEEKGRAAAARLSDMCKLGEGNVIEVWPLDLSSYESVVAFAQRTRSLDRLDIVNLNAGISPAKRVFNQNTGHDEVIQVNYLSTALLAILLLPVMKEKRSNQPRPGRITLTLSEVASWTKFKEQNEPGSILEALDSNGGNVDPLDRMWVSKLLGQFLLVRLAAEVPTSVALINGASPGAVYDSEFGRDFETTFSYTIFKKLVLNNCGNSSERAAWFMTDAIVNHGDETHGKFLSFQKVASMAPIVSSEQGENVSTRLWNETMKELSFANVEDILRTVKD